MFRVSCRSTASVLLVLSLSAMLASAAFGAPSVQQTRRLQPGWNAVYLEVEPADASVEAVLAGLPVSSVWTPTPNLSSVEYIEDPADGLFNRPGWLGYRPSDPPFLRSLYVMQANRPYLIKLEGGQARDLVVVGRPSLRDADWKPDSFNLTGLPVDPAVAVTFDNFFEPSPAHVGQPVYRLDPAGQWRLIDSASTTIASGEAYWVYSEGRSSYAGPLTIDVELGDGIDFQGVEVERTIHLGSLVGDGTAVVRQLSTGSPVPLSYRELGSDGAIVWLPLTGDLPVAISSAADRPLRIAVRRAALASASAESVLEVTDGSGSRRWIPVRADRRQRVPSAGGAGGGTGAGVPALDPFSGLWLGLVTVSSVSEPQTEDRNAPAPSPPTPAASEFGLRFIVHVDGLGNASLLEQVIQMWEEGTLNPDGSLAMPGRFVLLSDDDRIPLYEGASVRDGDPIGLRVSTAAYSFEGNQLPMTGTFDPAGTLTTQITLGPDLATHPYKHSYHPDHDDLDPLFIGYQEEAYAVSRSLELSFSAVDPLDQYPPEWGDAILGGAYREVVTGLHRRPIAVEGSFRFRRLVDTPELNP